MRGADGIAGCGCGERGMGCGVARAALVHPTLRLDDVDIRLRVSSPWLVYVTFLILGLPFLIVFRWGQRI
jgi:hypothetical protein